MKTLKTITAAFLMFLSLNSFAADGSAEKLKMNYALKTYVDAVAHGKVENVSEVLDKDIKYTITRGERILSYTKNEMLSWLKKNTDIEQNCVTDYKVIETTGNHSIVKFTMKYDGFSNVAYLSLANTQKGWKIVSISSEVI